MTSTQTSSPAIESIMTREPIAVTGSMTASELAMTLDENEISGVPVVDGQDRVVGVVSRTDLLHRCVEGPLGSTRGSFLSSIAEGLGSQFDSETLGVVSEFMEPEPVTAAPSEPIGVVARRMIEERVHRMVIVDEDRRLLGIVTSLDMVRQVAS